MNKEGKLMIFTTELGYGAISRLYLGEMDGKMVAVKKLRAHLSHCLCILVDAYTYVFHACHPKICATLGLCPNSGLVILVLCQKILSQQTVHIIIFD